MTAQYGLAVNPHQRQAQDVVHERSLRNLLDVISGLHTGNYTRELHPTYVCHRMPPFPFRNILSVFLVFSRYQSIFCTLGFLSYCNTIAMDQESVYVDMQLVELELEAPLYITQLTTIHKDISTKIPAHQAP